MDGRNEMSAVWWRMVVVERKQSCLRPDFIACTPPNDPVLLSKKNSKMTAEKKRRKEKTIALVDDTEEQKKQFIIKEVDESIIMPKEKKKKRKSKDRERDVHLVDHGSMDVDDNDDEKIQASKDRKREKTDTIIKRKREREEVKEDHNKQTKKKSRTKNRTKERRQEESTTEAGEETTSQPQFEESEARDAVQNVNQTCQNSNLAREERDSATTAIDTSTVIVGTKSSSIDEKKEIRKSRREERMRMMEMVPKTDENGISYTKLQLRRMRKRVARGLDPIETEEEKQERLKEEAKLRREEEDELAGIFYQKNDKKKNLMSTAAEDEEEEEGSEGGHVELHEEMKSVGDEIQAYNKEEDDIHDDVTDGQTKDSSQYRSVRENAIKTRTPRSRPVPIDYTCQACQNKHKPAHWIYDCPSKVTMRGSNLVSKRTKGMHKPDSRKVFVSGLPFDVAKADVTKIFASCGKIVSCKLITFPDSSRCKGQAILAFETESGAHKALEQDDSVIDTNTAPIEENSKFSKKVPGAGSRKELKLSVSKVLSRNLTKKMKKHVSTSSPKR